MLGKHACSIEVDTRLYPIWGSFIWNLIEHFFLPEASRKIHVKIRDYFSPNHNLPNHKKQ